MLEKYYHRYSGEELHTYGFIDWNFPENVYHPKLLNESEDFLFDEIQGAICDSNYVLEKNGWNCH
ncbi:hypothetical protein [Vibrio sp. 10N.261.55.A7]|uniref:hypothetical protein n=1 Tax=Vibrio sp. 10N.261.55.A7 TaxID=1880851 RepID=UPI000C85D533|nr:hypothetical protein [Vibrio sp. 10N.261.55.A7]PMK05007.1 hypothetical protein BCU12_01935 [Vibrio sp. 10N.261.55.A7]